MLYGKKTLAHRERKGYNCPGVPPKRKSSGPLAKGRCPDRISLLDCVSLGRACPRRQHRREFLDLPRRLAGHAISSPSRRCLISWHGPVRNRHEPQQAQPELEFLLNRRLDRALLGDAVGSCHSC